MKKQKKRILVAAGVAVLIFLTVVICYILFYKNPSKESMKYEDNATTGIMPGVDQDQRRKELQDILDKSLIAFSINTTPVFLNGTSEGNLLIENPGNNAKLLKISIVIDNTEEEIYSSNYIKPGSYIKSAKLSKVLEKGTYDATAYFSAYDQDTAEYIGRTGASITLTVEN